MAKIRDEDPARRDGRRRDDPHHLADDQGRAASAPTWTSRPSTTTWACENRDATDDQVTVDSAEATKRLRRGRQVRHHHPQRPARGGVPPQADVEEPQRHHPRHPGRHGVPRAHRGQGHRARASAAGKSPSPSPVTPTATCTRTPRCRVPGPRQGGARLHRRPTAPRPASSSTTSTAPAWSRAMHNLDASIESFARSCFEYALDSKQDLWFCHQGHHLQEVRPPLQGHLRRTSTTPSTRAKFEAAGIEYFYTLIDDAVARVMQSEGGFIWACKNYDGDVMSDMVSTAFGSLAMMTSVLVSARTATTSTRPPTARSQRHYYKHLKGEHTSTNSVATIFAWTGALRKRGELDGIAGTRRLRRPPGGGNAAHHRGGQDDRGPRPHHHPPQPHDAGHARVHSCHS